MTVRSCNEAVISYSSTELRKKLPDFENKGPQVFGPILRQIDRGPARHDAVHHQAMAKAGIGRSQYPFPQHSALRMHHHE